MAPNLPIMIDYIAVLYIKPVYENTWLFKLSFQTQVLDNYLIFFLEDSLCVSLWCL